MEKMLHIEAILIFSLLNQAFSNKDSFQKPERAFLRRDNVGIESLSLDEARRRLRLLLPYIDVNKDGSLSRKEIEDWVQVKYEDPHESEDLEAEFRETDENFDNKVDWNEYMQRRYNIRENATDSLTMSRLKNYQDLINRDKRRWEFLVGDTKNTLNHDEFMMFKRPTKHKEMLRIVAEEELQISDSDKDGFLSLEEYLEALHYPNMREYDTKLFNEKYDENKDGKLNLDEIIIWQTPESFNAAELEAKYLFDIADENKDDQLTPKEIDRHCFLFIGSKVTQSGQMLHDEF